MLLEIMSIPESKDLHAQLYSFRLIAILCRINPLIGQKFGGDIVEVLFKELIPTSITVDAKAYNLRGGLGTFEALQESSLLYSGYLLNILIYQGLIQPQKLVQLLKLSARRAVSTQMASCFRSFVLPVVYTLAREAFGI